MKVIDLLNKLANGEVPKKIKYDNDIYEYNKDYQDYGYFNTGIDRYITLIENELNSVFNLNEEVEIIEDTPKEDKKIEDIARFQYSQIPSWFDIKELIKAVNENFEKHQKALKEIIDKINGE